MTNNDRSNQLQSISEVSFYLDELRLFLDTHPNNANALSMYDEYCVTRKALVDEYVKAYGPLTYYDLNSANTWKWVAYPWPWEGVN